MTKFDEEPTTIYANVAYDPTVWIAIPTYWGPETWPSPTDWAGEVAAEWWTGLEPGPQSIPRLEAILTHYGERHGGTDPDQEFEIVTYLHLPHPGMHPLLLRLWVDDTPGVTVEWAAQAEEEGAVEPPVVEKFATEHLGTGLRVLQYHAFTPDEDQDGGGDPPAQGLYAALRYAFAVPGHEAVVTVFALDPDLGRLLQAKDDIDEFVRGIEWDYEPRDLVFAE